MSFGFTVCGNATNVAAKIESAFDKAAKNCKAVPHEAESIQLAKIVALKQLDFYKTLEGVNGVTVNCSGHASNYSGRGDSTFILEVKPLYGFVE